MAIIGAYRLAVHNLLYERPICNYISGKKENVLILGSGWVGNESFKAVFSAGQFIDTELNITIASSNAEAYGEKMKSAFPALEQVMKEKVVNANVEFKNVKIDSSDDSINTVLKDLNVAEFTYFIIALGDEQINKCVASEIVKAVESVNKKILVAVFAETEENEVSEANKTIETYYFNTNNNNDELIRLAKNINFAYAMKENERKGIEKADSEFTDCFEKEFVNSPEDKEITDLSFVENFKGADYSADSSIASAMHIPYKLAACKKMNLISDKTAEDILSESIANKDKTYNSLIELEHRRWCAYMCMRGFRAPTTDEENTLYNKQDVNGKVVFNDHRDKHNLLHLCMCKADTTGVVLTQESHWRASNKNYVSELDKMSIKAYKLARERAKELYKNKETLFENLDLENVYHRDLKIAIEKLFNNDCNSLILYEQSLEKAKEYTVGVEKLSELDLLNFELSAVKCMNRRTDFTAIDAQLIDFLPFCSWYRKKYKTVITLTTKLPVKDVVVPTVFCAEKAVFIGPNIEKDDSYKTTIKEYFANRGNTTKLYEFVNCNVKDLYDISYKLSDYKDELENQEALINVVSGNDDLISVSVGKMAGEYKNINVLRYDSLNGIISILGNGSISTGIDNKSFSVEEVIDLIGGKIKNPNTGISSDEDRDKLMNVFKQFCKKETYYDIEAKKTREYNIWQLFNTFMTSNAKDISTDFNKKEFNIENCNKQQKTATLVVSNDVYQKSGFEKLLNALKQYKIIGNYSDDFSAENTIRIKFTYCEKEILNWLKLATIHHRFEFNLEDGIKFLSLRIDSAKLYSFDEHETIKTNKMNMMKSLRKKGFVENLSNYFSKREMVCPCGKGKDCKKIETCKKLKEKPQDNLVSFEFRDARICWLLKQQGVPFEEILYHLSRWYGSFNDVQTGVKLAWDKNFKREKKDIIAKIEEIQQRVQETSGSENEIFGYFLFKNAVKELKGEATETVGSKTENEIDVIAVNGMTPIFISAKTNKEVKKEWLYEIDSISKHFGAIPVMAVAQDCSKFAEGEFVGRAKSMGVSLIGFETLWDNEKLQVALSKIAKGELVTPREEKTKELEEHSHEL